MPLDLDDHPFRGIEDRTGQSEFMGQTINERAESHPLDLTGDSQSDTLYGHIKKELLKG
jgi:hypothetical protein